jgi:hypothetical protein
MLDIIDQQIETTDNYILQLAALQYADLNLVFLYDKG